MRSKAQLIMFLVLLQGSFAAAKAQSPSAVLGSALVPDQITVPLRYTAAASTTFGSSYRFERTKLDFFTREPDSVRTAFWTEQSLNLLESSAGRVVLAGSMLEFNGKALLHPSSATPVRDALRSLSSASGIRNAPTLYGLRLTVRVGRH